MISSFSQILVTKPDFYNENSRNNLRATLNDLLNLNIIPIINANDAVAPPPEPDVDLSGVRYKPHPTRAIDHMWLSRQRVKQLRF